jgi:hypothetical protein
LGELQAEVDAHANATIEEQIEYWASNHTRRVGRATICRALQRADRPRKKNVGAKERDVVERVLFSDYISTLAAQELDSSQFK